MKQRKTCVVRWELVPNNDKTDTDERSKSRLAKTKSTWEFHFQVGLKADSTFVAKKDSEIDEKKSENNDCGPVVHSSIEFQNRGNQT